MFDNFIKDLSGLLEIKASTISLKEKLHNFQYWDSLAQISTIGLIDQHFKVSVSGCAIEECDTVEDMLNLIGNVESAK